MNCICADQLQSADELHDAGALAMPDEHSAPVKRKSKSKV